MVKAVRRVLVVAGRPLKTHTYQKLRIKQGHKVRYVTPFTQPRGSTAQFAHLPAEIVAQIGLHLPRKSARNFRLVSRSVAASVAPPPSSDEEWLVQRLCSTAYPQAVSARVIGRRELRVYLKESNHYDAFHTPVWTKRSYHTLSISGERFKRIMNTIGNHICPKTGFPPLIMKWDLHS